MKPPSAQNETLYSAKFFSLSNAASCKCQLRSAFNIWGVFRSKAKAPALFLRQEIERCIHIWGLVLEWFGHVKAYLSSSLQQPQAQPLHVDPWQSKLHKGRGVWGVSALASQKLHMHKCFLGPRSWKFCLHSSCWTPAKKNPSGFQRL